MAPQTDRSSAFALPSVARIQLPKARLRLTVLQDRSAALSEAELRVVPVRARERTRVQVGVRVKRFKGRPAIRNCGGRFVFEVALDTPTVEAYGLRVVPHQCRRTSIEYRLVSREPDEFVRRGESDGRDGEGAAR